MKKLEINNEAVETLSYAISEYVNSLGDDDSIEGIFVMPCGDDKVDFIVLGIVYNNYQMGYRIDKSNKTRLHMYSHCAGVSMQVKSVSLEKCLDYFSYRSYEQPIKGMVKSSSIIYDPNGKLSMLKEEYRRDPSIHSLESRGAVEMEPAIQYAKKKRTY